MGESTPRSRRLLVLSVRAQSPGQRFRIQTWAPYLAKHGISTIEIPFATPELEEVLLPQRYHVKKVLHTLRASLSYYPRLPCLRDFDAVLVYREAVPIGPPVLERWIGHQADLPMAFDVDDPIFVSPTPPPHPLIRMLRQLDKWRALCEAATVTIAINAMIAEELQQYARRVEVIPNALDLDRYAVRPPPSVGAGPLVLGYSGSPTTMVQLQEIEGALERVGHEVSTVLEVVGGTAPFRLSSMPVRERKWSPTEELTILQGFDIGLAPAPDNVWNRYKSFVKVLLYMAVGLPVVASPVGLPRLIIRDGCNGFLARTPEEWTERILCLAGNPDLRAAMGKEARATIERDYALQHLLPRVLKLFSHLIEERA